MKTTTYLRLAVIPAFCGALAVSNPSNEPANLMVTTAARFVDSLSPAQKAGTVFALDSKERVQWHYFPERGFKAEYGRDRQGIMFKEMDPKQRHLAYALMSSGLSQAGFIKTTTIMSIEEIVRVIEADTTGHRDAERYHFTIFGTPASTGTWAWRVEGHHVVLNFTLRDGKVVSASPTFFGANPHEVPLPPHKGLRPLDREEDLARQLVQSLDAKQRKRAIYDEAAPFDILSMGTVRARLEASPVGIPASALNPRQRALLTEVIAEYANNIAEPLAAHRREQARRAPLDKLYFAWAGTTERPPIRTPEIGRPTTGYRHREGVYYRVQSPEFLIEFNNTQNYANHSHSVWRDWKGDFGLDVLSLHHRLFDHGTGATPAAGL
ncbi:MAG: DUF3500 domain-containing protein [Bryobacterales bacterium]|nr:DUF3500 domain-containing protein [Bryobacterales bacterium]